MPLNTPPLLTPPSSPKNKLETAVAWYLATLAAASPASPLFTMWFYPSQYAGQKVLPCCIAFCEEASEIKAGSRAYQGGLYLYIISQKDDEALGVHDERLSLIQEKMVDSDGLMSALNYGSPTRPFANLTIFGYAEAKAQQNDRERHFGEHLYYESGFAGYDVALS